MAIVILWITIKYFILYNIN